MRIQLHVELLVFFWNTRELVVDVGNTLELVSEVGLFGPVANENMWFRKKKEDSMGDEKPLSASHVVTHVTEQQLCGDQ